MVEAMLDESHSVGRAAAPDDVPAVATCLTSAFYDDPVWGLWTFPEEASRAQRLYELIASGLSPACGIRGYA